MKLPSSGTEPPRLATALPLGSPLGSPRRCVEDASHRLLQPTSRNEHPNRSPDFRASRLAPRRPATADMPTTSRSPPPTPQRPAPNHLAAIRPRMSVRLTALAQLRSLRRSLSVPFAHLRGGDGAGQPNFPGYRARHGLFDRERDRRSEPLTLPVAPRRTPRAFAQSHLRGTRTASTAPASTRAAFPAQSAFHRRVLRDPFRDLGARHRSRGFAAALRLPTLFRSSNALAWRG